MTDEIVKLLENATTKNELAKIFGYKRSNGRISKEILELCKKADINLKNLGKRFNTRKYNRIIKSCPVCNNKFETFLNHKRERYTCSRECSNVHFAKIRTVGIKKRMTRNCSMCNDIIECGVTLGKNTVAYCDSCRKIVLNKPRIKIRNFKNVCFECGNEFMAYKETIKCCSKSCGSKYSMNKLVAEGKHSGWKSRKKLVPSYPEKYFMEVLNNMNIKYEYELPMGKYFIDFEIHDKMIALEIDGKQHNEINRKLSDIKKDEFLKYCGYNVVRIKWYNPINDTNKNKLYSQIEKFKKLLM